MEPQRSIVRFDEASLGRDEPKTNRTRGKAREKPHRHPNGEVLLDNADAVIDALPRFLTGVARWAIGKKQTDQNTRNTARDCKHVSNRPRVMS